MPKHILWLIVGTISNFINIQDPPAKPQAGGFWSVRPHRPWRCAMISRSRRSRGICQSRCDGRTEAPLLPWILHTAFLLQSLCVGVALTRPRCKNAEKRIGSRGFSEVLAEVISRFVFVPLVGFLCRVVAKLGASVAHHVSVRMKKSSCLVDSNADPAAPLGRGRPPGKAPPPAKAPPISKAGAKAVPPLKRVLPPESLAFGKKIHWVKPMCAAGETVFSKIHDRQEPMVPLLKAIFDVQPAAHLSSPLRRLVTKDSQCVCLLGQKTAQNVAIALRKVGCGMDALCRQLINLQSDGSMKEEDLELLLNGCPSEKELEKVVRYTGPTEELRDVEQAVLQLAQVSRIEARLRLLLLQSRLEPVSAELKEKLKIIQLACAEIKNSGRFRTLLAHVLSMANYTNYGIRSITGGAEGFCIQETLPLLQDFKTNNDTSAVHYVCLICMNEDMEFSTSLQQELGHIAPAAKAAGSSLAQQIHRLKTEVAFAEKELEVGHGEYSKPAPLIDSAKLMLPPLSSRKSRGPASAPANISSAESSSGLCAPPPDPIARPQHHSNLVKIPSPRRQYPRAKPHGAVSLQNGASTPTAKSTWTEESSLEHRQQSSKSDSAQADDQFQRAALPGAENVEPRKLSFDSVPLLDPERVHSTDVEAPVPVEPAWYSHDTECVVPVIDSSAIASLHQFTAVENVVVTESSMIDARPSAVENSGAEVEFKAVHQPDQCSNEVESMAALPDDNSMMSTGSTLQNPIIISSGAPQKLDSSSCSKSNTHEEGTPSYSYEKEISVETCTGQVPLQRGSIPEASENSEHDVQRVSTGPLPLQRGSVPEAADAPEHHVQRAITPPPEAANKWICKDGKWTFEQASCDSCDRSCGLSHGSNEASPPANLSTAKPSYHSTSDSSVYGSIWTQWVANRGNVASSPSTAVCHTLRPSRLRPVPKAAEVEPVNSEEFDEKDVSMPGASMPSPQPSNCRLQDARKSAPPAPGQRAQVTPSQDSHVFGSLVKLAPPISGRPPQVPMLRLDRLHATVCEHSSLNDKVAEFEEVQAPQTPSGGSSDDECKKTNRQNVVERPTTGTSVELQLCAMAANARSGAEIINPHKSSKTSGGSLDHSPDILDVSNEQLCNSESPRMEACGSKISRSSTRISSTSSLGRIEESELGQWHEEADPKGPESEPETEPLTARDEENRTPRDSLTPRKSGRGEEKGSPRDSLTPRVSGSVVDEGTQLEAHSLSMAPILNDAQFGEQTWQEQGNRTGTLTQCFPMTPLATPRPSPESCAKNKHSHCTSSSPMSGNSHMEQHSEAQYFSLSPLHSPALLGSTQAAAVGTCSNSGSPDSLSFTVSATSVVHLQPVQEKLMVDDTTETQGLSHNSNQTPEPSFPLPGAQNEGVGRVEDGFHGGTSNLSDGHVVKEEEIPCALIRLKDLVGRGCTCAEELQAEMERTTGALQDCQRFLGETTSKDETGEKLFTAIACFVQLLGREWDKISRNPRRWHKYTSAAGLVLQADGAAGGSNSQGGMGNLSARGTPGTGSARGKTRRAASCA